jgi:hypothetical protein
MFLAALVIGLSGLPAQAVGNLRLTPRPITSPNIVPLPAMIIAPKPSPIASPAIELVILSPQLINVDFGGAGGRGYSLKTGFAGVGLTTNDFWNFYDRDLSPAPYDWRTSGTLTNLQSASGAPTTVGMTVSDAPGAWGNGSSDPMYGTYDYPLDGGINVVTFTNLPAGQYDVLAYSQDGNYEVTVGGTSYGVKTTYDSPVSSVPVWTEGVQYARWRNVTVTAGQPLVLTVRNGVGGWAILAGVQILSDPPPPSCTPPPSGLVGWWPGENNANDIAGGNNGVLQNGVGFSEGMVGTAFEFNGTNSYVEVPDAPALRLTNSVTIEFWVKRQRFDDSVEYCVEKGGDWTADQQNYGVALNRQSYNDCLSFHFAGGWRGAGSVADGNWHHCAVVARNGDVDPIFYIDGVMQPVIYRDGAGVINLYPSTRPLHIGAQVDPVSGWNYFGAVELDEVSIYNSALGSAEIQAIYNAGAAGKCAPTLTTNCVTPPAGLIGWWKGDGNGNDSSVGGNNAVVPADVTYAPAEVGEGFSLDGHAHQIIVPDAPVLNFSSNQDFSLEVWIQPLANPQNWQDIMSIIDKRIAPDTITQLGYELNLQGGVVVFQMADVLAPFSWNNFSSGPDLRDGKFHHVAVTVQRNSTSGGQIYIDGQSVLTFDPTVCPGDLSNTGPFRIGNHATPGLQAYYHGIIDEVSLYNRALTAVEVQAIYNAGSAGKCEEPLPPGITVQPSSQISVEGSNVVLSVTASGNGPFSYQWSFNGTNISGATNSTLILTDLHPYQSGNYMVTITTPYGSITSAGAAVTVIAQTILIYDYSGMDKCTSAGHTSLNAYAGRLFFIPDTTNGTFVGWTTERGKKQYWVNPLSDYLLITVAGEGKHMITVLGQAGQGVDANGKPHLWSDLHQGQNTLLTIGQNKHFSFPESFADAATRIYPDSVTGSMVLDEATTFYKFLPEKTQDANNHGQTLQDLVNTLTNKLTAEGYLSR